MGQTPRLGASTRCSGTAQADDGPLDKGRGRGRRRRTGEGIMFVGGRHKCCACAASRKHSTIPSFQNRFRKLHHYYSQVLSVPRLSQYLFATGFQAVDLWAARRRRQRSEVWDPPPLCRVTPGLLPNRHVPECPTCKTGVPNAHASPHYPKDKEQKDSMGSTDLERNANRN